MQWQRIAGVLCLSAVAAALGRAQGAALTVSDLVDAAVRQNRDFLAARQRVAEMQGLLRQAGVRPAPAVEVEAGTGRPVGSPTEQVLSAGYFHTVETAGKRDKRIAAARRALEAAEAELADRLRVLALDVKVKYAHALREQQKLQTIGRLSTANRQYYTLTEARVRSGDAAPLEAALFLGELNRVEAQQVMLTSAAERAVIDLRKSIGLPSTEALPLAPASDPPAVTSSLADLQARALRDRPDLRALKALEEQAIADEQLAVADKVPDLTVSARYSRIDSGFDQLGYSPGGALSPIRSRDHMLTFGLSFLLAPPARYLGAIEAAAARTSAARLRTQQLGTVIRLDVEAAYRRWQASASAVELLKRGVIDRAEANLSVIRTAYSLGQLRILDVLNEQRRLIDTQLAYVDARSDLLEAIAELEAAVGGPLP